MNVRAKNPAPQIAKLYAQGPWIVCKTPYSKEFVEELKAEIHYTHRKWDMAEKVWKVDVDHLDLIEEICRRYFKEVVFIESEEPAGVAGTTPYHDLICELPNDALKRVYRLVAASIHPDQGGSDEAMSRANDAWRLIQKERGI
jgi:hypothetical protein